MVVRMKWLSSPYFLFLLCLVCSSFIRPLLLTRLLRTAPPASALTALHLMPASRVVSLSFSFFLPIACLTFLTRLL